MIDPRELRAFVTEYAEAEYQLSKIVAKEVPVHEDDKFLFFAELERREENVRVVSTIT